MNTELDRTVTYKVATDSQGKSAGLKLHIFNPPDHKPSDRRPAIVFFFGGGWAGGTPAQFYPHCAYLAARGLVAMSAEYRVETTHHTTPKECVQDGKSAVRWVRRHAVELGIDAGRLAVGGGSAGGQVAAAAGMTDGLEEKGEDLDVSSRPDALVLFNPVFDNGPGGFGYELVKEYWEQFSPLHNISEKSPPTIVFLGTRDDSVPVATAEKFKSLMAAKGRRCDLHLYAEQEHGFFNFRNQEYYAKTVLEMDRFLASLGYLNGEPTITPRR
jgi:acetyl esterase/lipase